MPLFSHEYRHRESVQPLERHRTGGGIGDLDRDGQQWPSSGMQPPVCSGARCPGGGRPVWPLIHRWWCAWFSVGQAQLMGQSWCRHDVTDRGFRARHVRPLRLCRVWADDLLARHAQAAVASGVGGDPSSRAGRSGPTRISAGFVMQQRTDGPCAPGTPFDITLSYAQSHCRTTF